MPNLTRVSAPCNKNLGKDEPQTFEGLCDEENYSLGDPIIEVFRAPSTSSRTFQRLHRVESDAYNKLIGFFLLRKQRDGADGPVGHWFRSLSEAVKAYDTMPCK